MKWDLETRIERASKVHHKELHFPGDLQKFESTEKEYAEHLFAEYVKRMEQQTLRDEGKDYDAGEANVKRVSRKFTEQEIYKAVVAIVDRLEEEKEGSIALMKDVKYQEVKKKENSEAELVNYIKYLIG